MFKSEYSKVCKTCVVEFVTKTHRKMYYSDKCKYSIQTCIVCGGNFLKTKNRWTITARLGRTKTLFKIIPLMGRA